MHKIIPTTFTFISKFEKEKILNLNKNVGIIFRNYKIKINQDLLIKVKNSEKLKKFLENKKIKKYIYIKNKLINLIV